MNEEFPIQIGIKDGELELIVEGRRTWHCQYANCCKREKLCKPCNKFIAPYRDTSLHYQPVYGGYFYQCGACKEITV